MRLLMRETVHKGTGYGQSEIRSCKCGNLYTGRGVYYVVCYLSSSGLGKDNDVKRCLSAHLSNCNSTIDPSPMLLCVLLIAISAPLLRAQSDASGPPNAGAAFAGMWKGVCQDGKAFILLTLRSTSNQIEGTISLGNVSLDDSAGNKGWNLYRHRSSEP